MLEKPPEGCYVGRVSRGHDQSPTVANMQRFTCNISKQRVRSKELRQMGELTLRTNLEIRGDYRMGPVPVSVTYEASFIPDEQHWERDDENPEERYPVNYSRQFSTATERESHCATFYEIVPSAPVDSAQ